MRSRFATVGTIAASLLLATALAGCGGDASGPADLPPDLTMVEALPDSIKAAETNLPMLTGLETIPLGRQTLTGEIVDSKCFLGVMNPGQLLPHRACAIRCISGGIPPVLLVRQTNGSAIYLLLVSADGKPVNKQVLNIVAEPVQITGEVERQDDLLILRADPKTILRIK